MAAQSGASGPGVSVGRSQSSLALVMMATRVAPRASAPALFLEDGRTYTRQRCAVKEQNHFLEFFLQRPPERGFGAGHSIMNPTRSSSATPVSGTTRPLTETPAAITVRGSPDTSGCHHSSPWPSAIRR